MAEQHKIWIEQCEAAEGIEGEFGTQKALDYLVGEKFLNFLEAAETDANFRSEISAFVAKIKRSLSRGNRSNIWRRQRRASRSIQSCSSRCRVPCLAKRKSDSTTRRSRTCGRKTFGNAPVTCCWWSGRGNGCWGTNDLQSGG